MNISHIINKYDVINLLQIINIGIQAMFSLDASANEANHLEGVLLLQLIIQVDNY